MRRGDHRHPRQSCRRFEAALAVAIEAIGADEHLLRWRTSWATDRIQRGLPH